MTGLRPHARPSTLAVTCVALTAFACTETRRPLGEDCLKNADCISGVCSQLRCAVEPIILDAQITAPEAALGEGDAPSAADELQDSSEGGSDEGSVD